MIYKKADFTYQVKSVFVFVYYGFSCNQKPYRQKYCRSDKHSDNVKLYIKHIKMPAVDKQLVPLVRQRKQ